jgi:hypothetical protein
MIYAPYTGPRHNPAVEPAFQTTTSQTRWRPSNMSWMLPAVTTAGTADTKPATKRPSQTAAECGTAAVRRQKRLKTAHETR